MLDFIRIICAVPAVKVGDVKKNAADICAAMEDADRQEADIVLFPELSLTGYTCGDLFYQDTLLRGAEQALSTVLEATRNLEVVTAVGLPVQVHGKLYNCAAVIQKGRILGVVPKAHLPNYGESYEKRYFVPGSAECEDVISLCGQEAPFGPEMIFRCTELPELTLGVEICEDLWAPVSPSVSMAYAGAAVIGNLAASSDIVTKDTYRRQLVTMQSAKLLCGYLFASSGEGESTSDAVYGAHQMIAENGALLAERRYDGGHAMTFTDRDGQMYLSFHSPNGPAGDRREAPVFLAIREEDDRLVWDEPMPAHN